MGFIEIRNIFKHQICPIGDIQMTTTDIPATNTVTFPLAIEIYHKYSSYMFLQSYLSDEEKGYIVCLFFNIIHKG